MTFAAKIVTYKLTDLKKQAREILLGLALDLALGKRGLYKAEKCLNPIWHDLIGADWVFVDDSGIYQLTPEGKTLVREHYRSKLKGHWAIRLCRPK